MKEFVTKNWKVMLITAIIMIAVWYFFVKKKQPVALAPVQGNQGSPYPYYGGERVVYMTAPPQINRAQEKTTLSQISGVLNQLNAQFNASGCSANNVINSNAALNEMRMQQNYIQDINMRTLISTFVITYPSAINDCTPAGIQNKMNMISMLQSQIATYNGTFA
jgi:hypothetical protein